jgi:hypothetical protein
LFGALYMYIPGLCFDHLNQTGLRRFYSLCPAPALALELWTDWGVRGKWGKKLQMLGKGQFSSENHPIGLNNTFERKKIRQIDLWHQKAVFFLHVIYPRVWIITKQTKRWNMSLGLEETPPGSERVLCRPRGQRASRLTMQHITPSSSSECTLGKSFFFQAIA